MHFVTPINPSKSQESCIAAFKKLHSNWDIKIWPDTTDTQDETLNKFLNSAKFGAQRADIVRLWAVNTYGGIYLDSDFTAIKNLDLLLNTEYFLTCSEDGANLSNGFFGCTSRHPAIEAILKFLTENEPDWNLPPNVTTGPGLLGSVLRYREDIQILPRETFYPYNWNEKRPDQVSLGSFAIHEWAASWKISRSNKIKAFLKKPIKNAIEIGVKELKDKTKFFLSQSIKNNIKKGISKFKKLSGILHYYFQENETMGRFNSTRVNYNMTTDVVTKTRHGVYMILPGYDLSLVPGLMINGQFESREEHFFASTVKGGDWVIDVGANVGLFTLISASKCGPFGRVFAIEPDGNLCDYIYRSSKANWYHDRIQIMNWAASSTTSRLRFLRNKYRFGDQRIVSDEVDKPNLSNGFEISHIECKPLDEIFPNDFPIKILKINVEGHEVDVIQGARRMISSGCISYVMIELSRENNIYRLQDFRDKIRWIIDQGYTPLEITIQGTLKECIKGEDLFPILGHRNLILKINRFHKISAFS